MTIEQPGVVTSTLLWCICVVASKSVRLISQSHVFTRQETYRILNGTTVVPNYDTLCATVTQPLKLHLWCLTLWKCCEHTQVHHNLTDSADTCACTNRCTIPVLPFIPKLSVYVAVFVSQNYMKNPHENEYLSVFYTQEYMRSKFKITSLHSPSNWLHIH